MCKAVGNSGERLIAFSFAVIALATVFFTPVCLAQDPTTGNPVSGNLVLVTGSTPIGTQLLDNAGSLTVAPGGNYIFTVTLTSGSGTFQLASTGQVAMSLSAYAWPGFASNNYAPGPLDSNVTLSSFQYVDSTHASFALSVSSGASTGVDQIQANEFSSGAVWPIFIQPPSPPGLPNPPSPSTSCGTPSIASVTPDTWMAGQSYPITIVGSGFTNAAMAAANSNCTANQLTVSGQCHSVEHSYYGLDQDHGHGSARADRSNGDRDPHPLGGFVGGRTGRQSSYWRNGRVCCRYAYGCRRSAGNAAGCAKYRSGRLVSDSHHYLCVAKPLD